MILNEQLTTTIDKDDIYVKYDDKLVKMRIDEKGFNVITTIVHLTPLESINLANMLISSALKRMEEY